MALHWLELPVGLLFFGLVGLLAAMPIACTDFFWHLTLGRVIRDEGRIPRTDLFSAVHPDAPYVQPQWLWELWAAWVHGLGGLTAIRIAQAIVLVGSFVLLLWLLRKLVRDRVVAWALTSLALLLFMDRFRARPDALTLGFVAASLPLLVEPHAGAAWRRRAHAFVLAVLWANVHGGASLLLLLSMGALVVGTWLQARFAAAPLERLKDVGWLAACVVAGLALSPTLVPGLTHWFSLIGPQIDTGNQEWLPPYTLLEGATTAAAWLIALAPTVVLFAYVSEQLHLLRNGARAAERVNEWLLCGGYLVLSHHAVRNVCLCILPLVFMARRALGTPRSRGGLLALSLAGVTLVAAVVQDALIVGHGGLSRVPALLREDTLPDSYPEEAAAFIAEAGLEGGLFNEGKWGGYIIHRNWPRIHVFVDTRQNLTPEMWRVFMASLSAEQRPRALDFALQRWGVELALFRAPTFPLLEPPPDYVLLYRAGDQELYQHLRGKHASENLARAQRTLRRMGGERAGESDEARAIRVGAAAWLARPAQQRALAEAQDALRSSDAMVRGAASARVGELHYRAGLYAEAAQAFEGQDVAQRSTRHLYFAAYSCFAAGRRERARQLVRALEQRDLTVLSRRQLERLAMIRAALRATP